MEPREIIEALGGKNAVAAAIGRKPNSVSYWIQRGRIPADHAPDLLKLAAARKRQDITYDVIFRSRGFASARPS